MPERPSHRSPLAYVRPRALGLVALLLLPGCAAIVGSHNMNARSEAYNSEVVAVIRSEEIARQLIRVFEADIDLDPAARTIRCGDRIVPRPPLSQPISPENAADLKEEVGWKAGFLQKLRAVM